MQYYIPDLLQNLTQDGQSDPDLMAVDCMAFYCQHCTRLNSKHVLIKRLIW